METTFDTISTANPTSGAHTSGSTDAEANPGFFEAILTDDESVDDMVCDNSRLTDTVQKLLMLSLVGLLTYGFALGFVTHFIEAQASMSLAPPSPMLWMPPTIAGGFLAGIIICLPPFYFYTQLSGLDASFRLVTAQSLRVLARMSVILLGVMPFWVAWGLGSFLQLPHPLFDPDLVLTAGFFLPFLIGLSGMWSVYRSFRRLVDRLPITHRRRRGFVLRLVACWAIVLGFVTPVAMFRIADFLIGG